MKLGIGFGWILRPLENGKQKLLSPSSRLYNQFISSPSACMQRKKEKGDF